MARWPFVLESASQRHAMPDAHAIFDLRRFTNNKAKAVIKPDPRSKHGRWMDVRCKQTGKYRLNSQREVPSSADPERVRNPMGHQGMYAASEQKAGYFAARLKISPRGDGDINQ